LKWSSGYPAKSQKWVATGKGSVAQPKRLLVPQGVSTSGCRKRIIKEALSPIIQRHSYFLPMKSPDSHFYANPLTSGVLTLSLEESTHAIRVCRASEGDVLRLADGEGHFANGKIVEADAKGCKVQIDTVETTLIPEPQIHLGLACLKDEANEEVVFHSAQLLVGSVILLRTEYSQEPKNSDLQKVIRRCELKSLVSLKQSLKPWLTKILGPVTLEDWLQKYRGDIILCDINGASEIPPIATTTTLLVGPEGGFSEKEVTQIKAFCNGQVHLLKLGETRLRARTAAVVALGKLV